MKPEAESERPELGFLPSGLTLSATTSNKRLATKAYEGWLTGLITSKSPGAFRPAP
jgi:hypothetical protein